MKFPHPLTVGRLLRRRQRFLADVELADGTWLTAHCPNTGSMLGCRDPGSRVWLSESDNPRRKFRHTWELVRVADGALVGIHTGRSNALVREALEAGRLPQLGGFSGISAEVRYGAEGSRVDFVLDGPAGRCFLEVKNVTAAVDRGIAVFPDAVSSRGTRHLRELIRVRGEGQGAALVFCVQRGDVTQVRPADSIDPDYGRALRAALAAGVQVLALGAHVSPAGIELREPLPVVCP